MFRQMFEEKYMRFPQGKCKALTLSYDDGVRADLRLLEIFGRYGLKGTFNLNSKLFDCECWHGRMDEEQTFTAFSGSGQEVALHGARHIFLDKVPLAEAIKEVVDNRAYLEEKFQRIVRGMAYAYNGYTAEVKRALADLGVAYARTTNPTHAFTLPDDWLEWNPTCHHRDAEFKSLADRFFTSSPLAELKHRESWLFFVWGHSYEFDDDGNWEIMEDLGRRASGCKDVWLATNGEVCAYVKAYRSLIFSLDGERVYNPSAIPVWVEIRDRTYKIPAGGEVKFDKCD